MPMTAPKKRSLPLSQVYKLLEPGPVVLVTTARGATQNVMTMSWHTMMDFEPPIVGCVISNRDYTFELIRASKECVINIPAAKLAKKVVGVGNCSGRTVEKFSKFALTPVPASRVDAVSTAPVQPSVRQKPPPASAGNCLGVKGLGVT